MDTFVKDPDAVLDYKVNWAAWLGIDTIINSSWSAPEGINVDSNEFDADETVVWVSGGTVGTSYVLTNHITTLGGRQDDRSIKIKIKQK